MNDWINCEERLPSEKGEYLVTYHPCYWDKVEEDVKVGIDTFRGKNTWAKKKYQRVIAWQPLPQPYTADRKTEPLTCDGNCWMKKQNGEWLCEHCQRKPKTEPNCSEIPNNSTISKMEQVDKDINVRSKDEPQTDCAWK